MLSIRNLSLILLLLLTPLTSQSCPSQSPPLPPPTYDKHTSLIWETFSKIEASLSHLVSTNNNTALNTSSYSIEVTSSHKTLWSTFHTALEKNLTRPGAKVIDETSRYRIASITKTFTVLAILQQHALGTLSLDDTVEKFLPHHFLSTSSGGIDWQTITLRSLASQLSGLPRDWAQGDLLVDLDEDPLQFGLPPISPSSPDLKYLPQCDSYTGYKDPCTADQLLEHLTHHPSVFYPNQKSTYSNIAFEILGLVLANVTGHSYEHVIENSVLKPIGLSQTSFHPPSDEYAVLPKNEAWYWDIDEGVQNPTGGLFCSSRDMSRFLRHILTTYHNIADTKMNWLMPVSFTASGSGFYGMPWEIFRTESILENGRAVTFYTKGGGLPGYSTLILVVPEFDLGITIFTAGTGGMLDKVLDKVIAPLIMGAEEVARGQAGGRYAGTYSAVSSHADADALDSEDMEAPLNSTITLAVHPKYGLTITNWISNSTDLLTIIPLKFNFPPFLKFHAQVFPTFLHVDEGAKRGEKWRIAITIEDPGESRESEESEGSGIKGWWRRGSRSGSGWGGWEEFCVTDVDTMIYAGRPLNEVVFWEDSSEEGQEGNGMGMPRVGEVELSAFRIRLGRVEGGVMSKLVVQSG